MKILINASEIVKMGLWDNYVYYIIGSDKEAEKLLKENTEISLSERDALVIGLLKVIETLNLIHKFNTHITEFLTNKSVKGDGTTTLIRKKTLDLSVDKFLDKFPDYWEPNSAWGKSLKDLVEYIDEFKIELEKLEIHEIEDKNVIYEFYSSNAIKKLLRFNY